MKEGYDELHDILHSDAFTEGNDCHPERSTHNRAEIKACRVKGEPDA